MKKLIYVAAGLGLVLLSGCGGRVANPVMVTRAIDSSLTCGHLQAEFDNNLKRRLELTGESSDKVGNNIGLLIVSPLFLDLSDTQKVEAKALVERNAHLQELATQKSCPTLVGSTPAPAPAKAS